MTASLPRCVALLLLVLPFAPAVAVAPDDTEVERLIKQLGSDQFKEREAATKRLQEIGEPALDALDKALSSADAEKLPGYAPQYSLKNMLAELRHFDAGTGGNAGVT